MPTPDYIRQMSAAYDALKCSNEETRDNMFKRIDVDLKARDMVKESQLSVATRLKQACAQLGHLVCANPVLNPPTDICSLGHILWEV